MKPKIDSALDRYKKCESMKFVLIIHTNCKTFFV